MDIFPIKLCVCPSTITFGAVVAYWHTSTPTTVPTSTRPSLISPSYSGSLLDVVGSMQRGLQTWGWPEALLTNLGGHKAIFMQPDLPLLPSLPRPRIVSDHVLEETPPCNWMLWAKKRGSSAEGIYMRPSSQPRGSTTSRVLRVEAAVHQCLLQGHMGLGIPQWGSVLPPPNTQTFYTIYMYIYPCPCMCIYPSVHRNA